MINSYWKRNDLESERVQVQVLKKSKYIINSREIVNLYADLSTERVKWDQI